MADEGRYLDVKIDNNSPEVRKWFARVMYAQKARKLNFDEKAKENIDYYLGKQYANDSDTQRVPLNWYASLVDTLIPAVYSRNPKVMVRPKVSSRGNLEFDKQTRELAGLFQSLLNVTVSEIQLKATMKEVIKDSALTGRGYVKMGYSGQVGKDHGKTKVRYLLDKITGAEKKTVVGVPIDTTLDDKYLKKERVWVERISPFRFCYDPEARNLSRAKWCIHEVTVPLEHVTNNPIYKHRESIKASDHVRADYLADSFGASASEITSANIPDDVKRVTLWEIWDKESQRIYVMARGNENLGFLRDDKWPFKGLEGFPFAELMPIPVPDSQWGVAEVDRIRDGQDQYNQVSDQLARHIEISVAHWAVLKGAMEKDELAKFANGEIGEIIEFAEKGALEPLTAPTVPSDYFNYLGVLQKNNDENSKMPSWRRAGQRIGARSATEVAEITQGLDVIQGEKVDVVQDFTLVVMRKVTQIIQEKYGLSHLVPIVGEKVTLWRAFTPNEIKEELEIQVVPYSATPTNPDAERNQYLQAVPLVLQAAQAGVPINLVLFLKKVFEKLQIHDVDEWLGQEAVQAAGSDPAVQAALSQVQAEQPGQQQGPGYPNRGGLLG